MQYPSTEIYLRSPLLLHQATYEAEDKGNEYHSSENQSSAKNQHRSQHTSAEIHLHSPLSK